MILVRELECKWRFLPHRAPQIEFRVLGNTNIAKQDKNAGKRKIEQFNERVGK